MMRTVSFPKCVFGTALFVAMIGLGCDPEPPPQPPSPSKEAPKTAEAKKVLVGKHVWF
jgi:hypothetical protein